MRIFRSVPGSPAVPHVLEEVTYVVTQLQKLQGKQGSVRDRDTGPQTPGFDPLWHAGGRRSLQAASPSMCRVPQSRRRVNTMQRLQLSIVQVLYTSTIVYIHITIHTCTIVLYNVAPKQKVHVYSSFGHFYEFLRLKNPKNSRAWPTKLENFLNKLEICTSNFQQKAQTF